MIKIHKSATIQSLIDYGFTNKHKPNLYHFKSLGNHISFNMTVPIDTLSSVKIDVLDEYVGQPYDYQYYLQNNPDHELAVSVKNKVENILSKMQEDCIIEGFEKGMYI